ncbi:hypothetical protein [Gallaecimonas pentaromativorans]|uniref:hypothetical protein n=1 Tax=Gallaecimonas pentaromativorans TaxID=584787 RepID=UPI0012EE0A9A|nr:hypothetical protein [Gallaecimonas pentaromativorans]
MDTNWGQEFTAASQFMCRSRFSATASPLKAPRSHPYQGHENHNIAKWLAHRAWKSEQPLPQPAFKNVILFLFPHRKKFMMNKT